MTSFVSCVLSYGGRRQASGAGHGSITTSRTAKPGTYSVELSGQADRYTFYRGSLTVIVLPSPIMSVSVQQTGYDASSDEMIFNIQFDRLYGYDKPITSMYDQSWNAGVLQQMECAFDPINFDTVTMYCLHINGSRPTSGTMHVNVNVPADSFNADAAFNLPPK